MTWTPELAKDCFPNAEVRCSPVDPESPPAGHAYPAGEPSPPANAAEIASQCQEVQDEHGIRHYGCPIGGVVAGIIDMIAVMVSCYVGLRIQPKETGDTEKPQVCAASLSNAEVESGSRAHVLDFPRPDTVLCHTCSEAGCQANQVAVSLLQGLRVLVVSADHPAVAPPHRQPPLVYRDAGLLLRPRIFFKRPRVFTLFPDHLCPRPRLVPHKLTLEMPHIRKKSSHNREKRLSREVQPGAIEIKMRSTLSGRTRGPTGARACAHAGRGHLSALTGLIGGTTLTLST